MREILRHGPDLDQRDDFGDTALWWAAAKGHADVVTTLLEAGSDRSLARWDGTTPLDAARRGAHATVIKLLMSTR